MEIEGSTLRLDANDREQGVLTSVELPDGSGSGGVLVAEGDTPVFVLFADEALEVGDEVEVVASRRRFTITYVRHAHLGEQRVTALGIRAPDTEVPGVSGASDPTSTREDERPADG